MGLDAIVECTCQRDGAALPPPCDASLIRHEEGTTYLDLPRTTHKREHAAFDWWRNTACPHPRFEALRVEIGTWWGVSLFVESLRRLGATAFPVLIGGIPNANGGQVEASLCGVARQELRAFESRICELACPALIDTSCDTVLAWYTGAQGGELHFIPAPWGQLLGFDGDGIFVRSLEGRLPLFQARRVEQRVLERDPGSRRAKRVDLLDLDTGRHFACGGAVLDVNASPAGPVRNGCSVRSEGESPMRLHVESRPMQRAHFAYVLDALEPLFEIAVQTGNPVHWR